MKKRLAILALFEAALLFASFYLAMFIRFAGDLSEASSGIGPLFARAVVFSGVILLALLSVGLFRPHQNVRFVETVTRLIGAIVLATVGHSVIYYLVPSVSIWRGAHLLGLGLAYFGLLGSRTLFYAWVGSERFKRNVLIFGRGKSAASLASLFANLRHRSFRVVGYLPVPGEFTDEVCIPALADPRPLPEIVREHQVDEIVVAMDNRRSGFPIRALLDCRLAGVRITEALTFAERETGMIDLKSLHPSWLIYGNGFRRSAFDMVVKRVFDIVASLMLLVLISPLLLAATVGILIEGRGRGGVLYRQNRVGLHGQTFEMLKLRSMIPNAEGDGRARWAARNDARVTRVGALLRRFRIDELPQIFNVLNGEMSFVGPRPERPEFVAELNRQIPYYTERHCVKPGLAGWAQLCYPYGASTDDARKKLQYDLFYVKNQSPMLDLLILFETFEVVVWGRSHSAHLEGNLDNRSGEARRAA